MPRIRPEVPLSIPDLDAALTGARLVEEAGALLTLGEEPERMVAHAFERLGQLVPYDLATVLLREGDSLRVAHAVGPLATPQLSEALIPVPSRRMIRARTPSTASSTCPTATAAWWHPCAARARPSGS